METMSPGEALTFGKRKINNRPNNAGPSKVNPGEVLLSANRLMVLIIKYWIKAITAETC